jgi:hypothetical protein
MTSMTGQLGMRGPTGANVGKTSTGKWAGDKAPPGQGIAQIQQFTPEQLQLFQQLFQHAGPDSYLSKLAGGDQSTFDQIEAPALRQFGALQGNIASRFSAGGGQGSLSNRRSSGFQNTLGAETSNFSQQLQSNRQALQRQAIQDLQGLSNSLLGQRPYERQFYEKPQTNWGGLAGAGIGGIGGFLAGGPMGAMQGAQLGYNVGSAF